MKFLNILKAVGSVIALTFVAAPTIPTLAPYAMFLAPIGGLIAGWLHLPQPGASAP